MNNIQSIRYMVWVCLRNCVILYASTPEVNSACRPSRRVMHLQSAAAAGCGASAADSMSFDDNRPFLEQAAT